MLHERISLSLLCILEVMYVLKPYSQYGIIRPYVFVCHVLHDQLFEILHGLLMVPNLDENIA